MRKKIIFSIALALLVLMTGCHHQMKEIDTDTGEASDLAEMEIVETEMETELETMNGSEENESSNIEKINATSKLEILYVGGVYEVVSWSLYENRLSAGISESELTEYGATKGDGAGFLTVTLKLTSSPNYWGDMDETVYVNNFFPVTEKAINEAYLPQEEPDTVNRMHMEYGSQTVYLDIANVGQKNYFEVSYPSEGESIIYTIGYDLTEEEYKAAEEGRLYLWYHLDEAQSIEELQLLHLYEELRV